MKGGKISEVLYKNLDNTERVALEFLLKMQSLQSIEVEQLSKNTSKSLPHLI
jgi:glucan phosphorylase